MSPSVRIKGFRDGLLITVGDGEWTDVQDALILHMQKQGEFIQGAKVTLDVGYHILHAAEMGKLRDKLSEFGVSLHAILSNSPVTEMTAQTLGLGTRLPTPHPNRKARPLIPNIHIEEAILVQRTLRSGFKLEHPAHIIVIGDVNPGAEVISGGSIVVWGRLRGVAHAGAEGDENAYVCALELSPTQLRIAGRIAISPKQGTTPKPEIAYFRDGQVIAAPWDTKFK